MRIAFVSVDDGEDVASWSGIPYHILQSLRRQGVQVENISPLKRTYKYLYSMQKVLSKITGTGFEVDRRPFAQASLSRQVESRLKGRQFDALFAISSTPIAQVNTQLPLFYWIDAVIEGVAHYYGGPFAKVSPGALQLAHQEQKSAMQRATNVIVASEWAARTANSAYNPGEGKVQVIRFGANMDIDHTFEDVKLFVEARRQSPCVLLFIGVDWERKGGALAFEAARLLNERGIPTVLKVVGCDAPEAPFVERLGFIRKNLPEGLQILKDLLRNATFFIMPTRAEAAGIVFCEAAAFGLPAIATKTGGVQDYVKDGKTGYCLPLEAQGSAYADIIQQALASPETYRAMSYAAFERYRQLLNWDTGVAKLIGLMEQAAAKARGL